MEHNGQTGITCLYNMMVEVFYQMLIKKYEPHIADVDFLRFRKIVAVPFLDYLARNFEKNTFPEEILDHKEVIKRSYWIFVRQFPKLFKECYEEYTKIDVNDEQERVTCLTKWLLAQNPVVLKLEDYSVGSAVLFAIDEVLRYLKCDALACF